MRKNSFTLFLLSLFVPAYAAEVSSMQAFTAVKTWQSQNSKSFNQNFSKPNGTVYSFKENGQSKSHVVMLEGGGFVVTSGDDTTRPILGFSSSSSFDPSTPSPLRDIIVALSTTNRTATTLLAKGASGKSDGFISQTFSTDANDFSISAEASSEWNNLLQNSLLARSFIYSVDDLRVEPLVKSKWSQGHPNDSIKVWNYYTPNNYPCGCVATMMAQVMRYHKHPKESLPKVRRYIYIDGTIYITTTGGGTFDWDNMPLVPTAAITETQKQAIGKLTYDCGIAVMMEYYSDGSGALPTDIPSQMTDVFRYKSCKYMIRMNVEGLTMDTDKNANAIFANLNAGYPVMLSILSSGGGHAVIADGYGYINETPYTHINLGWYGQGDSWFSLPDVDCTSLSPTFDFSIIYGILFNVFPDKTGEIVSGRVTDSFGSPIENVKITLTGNGKTFTTNTSPTGVWGIVADANTTYNVVASTPGFEASSLVSTTSSSTSSSLDSTYVKVGNVWDCDFILDETQFKEISISDFSLVNINGNNRKTFSCPLNDSYHEVAVVYCEKLGDAWIDLSSKEVSFSKTENMLTITLDEEKSSRPSGFFKLKARK